MVYYYAAYYLAKDGTKTRVNCTDTKPRQHGDTIPVWNGDAIVIDFELPREEATH